MQKIIGAPISPTWKDFPKTAEDWKAQVDAAATASARALPAMREALAVKLEPLTIDGVKAYALTPAVIPPENRNRLLIHVHGGCYVSNPGKSGTGEATMMAGFGRFKVISVDYRMPPDHPYPAALDDAMTVWKAVAKTTDPKNMAIFGSSAGGALTLSMVLRAKLDKFRCRRDRTGHADVRLHAGGRQLRHQRDGRQCADRTQYELRCPRRTLCQRP